MSEPGHRVATHEQAGLLLDVELRPLLGLLMNAPRTASEVAAQLGLSLHHVHYRLTRLAQVGVAEVALEPRAGRALKRYRVADRWFIPYEVTSAETLEAFVATQIVPRIETFVKLSVEQIGLAFGHWGYWHERDGTSSTLRLGDPNGASRELFEGDEPFLFNIGTMSLTREQASELKRRLVGVLENFEPLSGEPGQPYSFGLLMARGDVG